MTAPLALSLFADPWGAPRDYEPLHAEPTEAILQAVADLRTLARAQDEQSARPRPLVLLGTAGIGKTHLFSRLRRRLASRAVLVHIQPLSGSDMAPRYVLGQILRQLAQFSGDMPQIDALAGTILSQGLDGNPDEPQASLELLRELDEAGRNQVLEQCLTTLLARRPSLDGGYLEQLLRAPFLDPLRRNALLAWLGGEDLDEFQAKRIGIHEPLAEARVLPALGTLARIAASGSPLLLCFDQLENLIQPGDHGRITAYGNLIADLVNQVRDVVIVQMALETVWDRGIEPQLSHSHRDRACGRRFTLTMPDRSKIEGLLRLWLAETPTPAAFPSPFSPQEFEGLVGHTPRQILQKLQDCLEGAPQGHAEDAEAAADGRLRDAWEATLAKVRTDLADRDALDQGATPELLTDGFIQLIRLLEGLHVGEVHGPERIHYRRSGGDEHLSILHQAHHRSLGAALDRLARTSGLRQVVREHWRPFKPTWKTTLQKWEALCRQDGVRPLWLQRRDAERLLALDALMKAAVSRDLTRPDGRSFEPDEVANWIRRTLLPEQWEVAQALAGTEPLEESLHPPIPEPVQASSDGAEFPLPLALLQELGVASVDRLVREVQGRQPGSTRSDVIQALRSAGGRISWIGKHIVAVDEVAR